MKFKNGLPNENPYQLDQVRTLIWSLVIRMQELHDSMTCPLAITRESLLVIDNRAFLTGKMLSRSPAMVNSNYASLHQFLKDEFYCLNLHSIVENFLNLLISEPKKRVLISRHYAILPNAVRLEFLNNLHRFPRTMNHYTRVRFYKAVDSIKAGDWLTPLKKVKYMYRVFQRNNSNADKIQYETTFYGTAAYWLLKLLRNMHKHAVLRTRPPFLVSSEFPDWFSKLSDKQRAKYLKLVQKCCHKITKSITKGPSKTQREILDKVLELFPKFYVDLQTALDRENLLTLFCIHPQDVLQC